MPRGIPLGRIFGTDIYATPGFFGLLALYFLLWGGERIVEAAIFSIAVVLSLLVHEFGHVYAARRITGGRATVLLWFLGGLCLHEPAREPRGQLVISLMGPAFGLIPGLACLVALLVIPEPGPLLGLWLADMAWIGLIWTALNLMPILPLDGGQALRAALAGRKGPGPALATARRVSVVAAALFIPIGLMLGLTILPVLGIFLILQNWGPGR